MMGLSSMLNTGDTEPAEPLGLDDELEGDDMSAPEDSAKAEAGQALADALGIEVKDPVALCRAVKQIMDLESDYEPEV